MAPRRRRVSAPGINGRAELRPRGGRSGRGTALLAGLALLGGPGLAAATEAWLGEPFGQFAFVPHRRQFQVTPIYEAGGSGHYFDGAGQLVPYPAGATRHLQTGGVLVEYGLAPYVAADVTLSAVAARGPDASGLGCVSTVGLGDTQFGLRWRLLDEDLKESEPLVPTLTFRLGGLAPGTYDAQMPFAPGAGAAGVDTRLMMSDTLGASPVSLYGEVGWTWLAGSVPARVYGSAGMGFTLPVGDAVRSVSAQVGYAFANATSGGGIGADGGDWPGTDWRRLDTLTRAVEAGLALTDRGGRRYQFFARCPVAGRNAPGQTTFGFYVEIPFAKLPRRATSW